MLANLLNSYMRKPTNDTRREIDDYLRTKNGQIDLASELSKQNTLAYSFLKAAVKDYISTGHPAMEVNLFCFIRTAGPINLNLLADVYEVLSLRGQLPNDIYRLLNAEMVHSLTFLKILEAVTRKFTVLPQTNELILEILKCVNEIGPSIMVILQEGLIKREEDIVVLLNVIYNTVYCDLHPFYENNIDIFMGLITDCLPNHVAVQIVYTFVRKYNDCINKENILEKAIQHNCVEIACLLIKLDVHSESLVEFLYRNLLISKRELTEMEDDPIRYNSLSEPLKNIYRKELVEAFRHLLEKNNINGVSQNTLVNGLLVHMFKEFTPKCLERDVFVLALLNSSKCSSDKLNGFMADIIAKVDFGTAPEFLLSTIINFLVSCRNFSFVGLLTEKLLVPRKTTFFFKYVAEYLRDESNILVEEKIRAYLVGQLSTPDEYSSRLIAALARKSKDAEFKAFVLRFFAKNLEAGGMSTYFHLFDAVGHYGRTDSGVIGLIEVVIQNEHTEFYGLCVQVLACCLRYNTEACGIFQPILSFRFERSLQVAVGCLLAAGFKQGLISQPELETRIEEFLGTNKFVAYALIRNCYTPNGLKLAIKGGDYEEIVCVIHGLYKGKALDYENALEMLKMCESKVFCLSLRNVKRVVRVLKEIMGEFKLFGSMVVKYADVVPPESSFLLCAVEDFDL